MERLFISEILEESRAPPENPERLVNAIVPRMTRIVMTTMSSTRVKPWKLVILNLFQNLPIFLSVSFVVFAFCVFTIPAFVSLEVFHKRKIPDIFRREFSVFFMVIARKIPELRGVLLFFVFLIYERNEEGKEF